MALEVVTVVPVSQERCQTDFQIRELPRLDAIYHVEYPAAESKSFQAPDPQLAAHDVSDVIVVRGEAAPRAKNRVSIQARAPPRRLAVDLRSEIDRKPLHTVVRSCGGDLELAPVLVRMSALPAAPPRFALTNECVTFGDDDVAILVIAQHLAIDPDLAADLRHVLPVNLAANDEQIRSEEHTSELQSHSFTSYAVFCLKK